MKKRIVLTGLVLLSLTACLKEKKTTEKEGETTTEVTAETPKVTLDNGKLWIANPETTEGIHNLQKIISERGKEATGSVIKEALENEFQMIFEKCTMEGEAHEQLHNYLLPLKMKLNKLDGTNDAEVLKDIENYLKEYPKYFK
jgi:outer membrane lipopolysaccharide assembly protein LptE/RlpB